MPSGAGGTLWPPTGLCVFIKLKSFALCKIPPLIWGIWGTAHPSACFHFGLKKGSLIIRAERGERGHSGGGSGGADPKPQPGFGTLGLGPEGVLRGRAGTAAPAGCFSLNLPFCRLVNRGPRTSTAAGSTCRAAAGAFGGRNISGRKMGLSRQPSRGKTLRALTKIQKFVDFFFSEGTFFFSFFTASFLKDAFSKEPEFWCSEVRILANTGMAPRVAGRVFIHTSHTHTLFYPFFPVL